MPEFSAPAPVAARKHTEITLHGHRLEDDYAWMRQKDNPEVAEYLLEENAYTEQVMGSTGPLQASLYDEMLSHIKETDVSVPFRDGRFLYYTRTVEGQQYPIYCRKEGTAEAPEQIILNMNELAQGKEFMALGSVDVSPNGKLLAYSTDDTGFRQYVLRIRDLEYGVDLADTAERVGSLVWAQDNRTLFYTQEDEQTKRQYRLFRHTLGDGAERDAVVYEERDERFNLGLGATRDKSYLLLDAGSHTSSETRVLPADQPLAEWRLLAERREEIQYSVDHRNGFFYLCINDTSRNFRLVMATEEQLRQGSPDNWRELVAAREDVMLDGVDLFQSFAVLLERQDGLPRMRVLTYDQAGAFDEPERRIEFPEPAYSAHPYINREFEADRFLYRYESMVSPASVFEFNPATGVSTLLKEKEVPGGFDRSHYAAERIFAVANDGTHIPISVVYRRNLKGRGTNPLLIQGYGAYGFPLPVNFSSNRLSLLDRGMVLALAHVRGGGDLGKPWHDAGRLFQKMHTFTDFIAATEHLVANGYGDPARVALEGGSAGGLLVGAVVNLRPELYRVAIARVPFVDVMNTMLDASLPLTVAEYEEWGDPNQREFFEYMRQYSPYDNLAPKAYPAMLVKTSFHDSQVMYWEPAKYVARLRRLKTDEHVVLLQTNMSAGHGGASGRYDYLREIAFDYAFLLLELGCE